MILCDAGPLIALVDPRDSDHVRCNSLLTSLRPPLVTSWPCITEAMYFLGAAGGWHLQEALWRFKNIGLLSVRELTPPLDDRMLQLMERYQNVPMDIADASLVAIAESLKLRRVFTLDSDFRIYRTASGAAFDIIP